MTHSKKIMRNSLFMFITKILMIILGFVIRKIFIQYLSTELLGLNSLFSDLLGLLNLADMGLGIAVQFNLYKPIAEENDDRINSILNAAKRIYNIIGISIILAGAVIALFLQYFIKNNPFSQEFLRIVFILNVISTASSYFFVHKRLFLCAKEEEYITNLVDIFITLISSILKIVAIVVFRNYYVFTIINVIQAFSANAIINEVSNKKYKYLCRREKYDQADMKALLANIRELLPNKIGSYIFNNTDNVIISGFLGLTMVTCYANYFTITHHIFMIAATIAGIIKVSFGNMLQENNTEEQHLLFLRSYQMLQFFYSSICGVALLCLLNPFIEMWYGKEFVMPIIFSVVLTMDFYIHSMYQPLSMMLEVKGDFRPLKNQQIIAVIVNLIISILLVKKIGILGPVLGTLCVDFLTFIFRIHTVMYKHYRFYVRKYVLSIICYFVVFMVEYTSIYFIFSNINFYNDLFGFLIKGIMVCVFVGVIDILLFYRTSEFKYLLSRFRKQKI